MIREFDWRDLALVRRLASDGVCLHTETGLIHGINNWLSALRAYVAAGGNTITLVARTARHTARHNARSEHVMFGQVQLSARHHWAQVHYLAPRISEDTFDDWTSMLEQLARGAGARGVQFLVAQPDDDSPEYDALRQVGFVTYTHQRIWQHNGELPDTVPPNSLRPYTKGDQFGVNLLYQHIVPRLVQQIEPPPDYEAGFVWADEGEIATYFGIARGPLGIWVRPYLHPLAQAHIDVLMAALLNEFQGAKVPIYACVHSYQGGLQGALETSGFVPVGYQAIMVKRLGVGVLSPEFTAVAAVGASKVSTGPLGKI